MRKQRHDIKVSREDSDLLDKIWTRDRASKGSPNEIFYALRKEPDETGKWKKIRLHRIVAGRMMGRPLTSEEIVDHLNYDGLDNRRSNLRICTSAENSRRRRLNKNNSSGSRGVKPSRAGSWKASICYQRRTIHIGTYGTKEHAEIAFEAVYRMFCNRAHMDHIKSTPP